MENQMKFISNVEIKGLWGIYDFNWNLKSDVNILSGINGSGKSSILDCIASLVTIGNIPENLNENVKSIKITFDNGKFIYFEELEDTIRNIERKAKNNNTYKNIISDIRKNEGLNYEKIKSIRLGFVSFDDLKIPLKDVHQLINFNIISTFDNVISNSEIKFDSEVKTELDRELFILQKRYLDYQLNIGKRVYDEILKFKNKDELDSVKGIKKQHEAFIEIVDELFQSTNKKIDPNKNELTFLFNNRNISIYKLSSGEKQILLILLTILLQDNKQSIIFMDEPEISLHFDWQKKIIEFARKLNPNSQLIIATHSPAVIMEGWIDKVVNVEDLRTNI